VVILSAAKIRGEAGVAGPVFDVEDPTGHHATDRTRVTHSGAARG